MARKFIKKAIKRPGALRKAAGKGKESPPLTDEELNALEARAKRTKNTTLLRRVNLARTLRKLRPKKKAS